MKNKLFQQFGSLDCFVKYSLFLLALIFLLSSCSGISKQPAELVKRPKLSVNNKIAKDLIESELPLYSEFVRPLKPGKLTSVDYFNWDGDDKSEAYAFYRCKQDKEIGLMILKKENDSWSIITQIEIAGEDIAYADFVDINSDGIKDILFGSEKIEGVYGLANAYLWQDGEYVKVWSDVFTELVVDDLDDDGNKEIICLKHDRNNDSSIVAYKYENGYYEIVDEMDMDIYISGYYNVFSSYYTEGKKALFLDFNLGSKSATNLIILKDGKLKCLFDPLKIEQNYDISEKLDDIESRDVNNDGIVEFASNYKLNFSSQKNYKNKGMYAWKQYTENGQINFCDVVSMSFIDKNDFYEVIFPEKWLNSAKKGELTTIISGDNDKRKFVSFFFIGNDLSMYELLTVENFTKEEYIKWKESDIAKYYKIVNLYSGKNSNIIAYYNENIEPYNEVDKSKYKDLILNSEEIKANIRFIK